MYPQNRSHGGHIIYQENRSHGGHIIYQENRSHGVHIIEPQHRSHLPTKTNCISEINTGPVLIRMEYVMAI